MNKAELIAAVAEKTNLSRKDVDNVVNTMLDTKGVLEFKTRSWNFVTPGTGHDEAWWRRFVEALRATGYDGPLSIEQEDYTIPVMDALEQASALLHRVTA